MGARRAKALLQALFAVLGVVGIAAGIFAVLTGPDGQFDGAPANPSVESEFRFFAAFWAAYGVASLWVAPRIEGEQLAVRALAAFLFAGGVARGIGWIAEGRPDALYVVLMGLELMIPIAVFLLLSRLRKPTG